MATAMGPETTPSLRPARSEDALAAAELIDLAGEGLPAALWAPQAQAGERAIQVGARRALREEGGFSLKHVTLAEVDGRVAGMLLDYPLPDPYPMEAWVQAPEVVRPLLELESLCPGSWYINAVAVYPRYRGRGIGRHLMRRAQVHADGAGVQTLSLIVAGDNTPAIRLYRQLGYEVAGRRSVVPWRDGGPDGDWLLMLKPAPIAD